MINLEIEIDKDEFKKKLGVKDGRDGKDGKDAVVDEASIVSEAVKATVEALKPFLPTIPAILEELTSQGVKTREGLEELQGDERLDYKAIKGLEEILKDLDELKRRPARLGGGGFSKISIEGHIIDDETPTGAVNSVNTIFTLANTPNPSASLKVYVNGQRMRLTDDYTFSGRTITFITAPPATSIIICDYRI